MKKFSQLSLFNDKQVQRSFLNRFTRAPKKEMIKQFRLENLNGINFKLKTEPPTNCSAVYSMQYFSLNLHFQNRKNREYKKIKGKYFYN